MRVSLILLINLLLIPSSSEAGLDKFTRLDQIDQWLIERMVDTLSNQIVCRASIPEYWSWFGARIRLDKSNNLIIPSDSNGSKQLDENVLLKVKSSLKRCREDLIYLENDDT